MAGPRVAGSVVGVSVADAVGTTGVGVFAAVRPVAKEVGADVAAAGVDCGLDPAEGVTTAEGSAHAVVAMISATTGKTILLIN
jgi:hypothetical protein